MVRFALINLVAPGIAGDSYFYLISGWTNQVVAGNTASFYFKSFTGNATSCLYVDTTGSLCDGFRLRRE